MSITEFLSLVEEKIKDTDPDILKRVIEAYGIFEIEKNQETDEVTSIIPKIQEKEALIALNTLRLCEEQQDEGDTHLLQGLDRHERVMQARVQKSKR